AARETYEAGYRQINGYSPFPIEELWEAIGFKRTALPIIVLIGGIVGGLGGFFMQYWMEVVDSPINVAGKPLNSWPAFIPITFECTVLLAAVTAVIGMLALNGFPMPYHPVINEKRFSSASCDRLLACIESTDPQFDLHETWSFLSRLQPSHLSQVE